MNLNELIRPTPITAFLACLILCSANAASGQAERTSAPPDQAGGERRCAIGGMVTDIICAPVGR